MSAVATGVKNVKTYSVQMVVLGRRDSNPRTDTMCRLPVPVSRLAPRDPMAK